MRRQGWHAITWLILLAGASAAPVWAEATSADLPGGASASQVQTANPVGLVGEIQPVSAAVPERLPAAEPQSEILADIMRRLADTEAELADMKAASGNVGTLRQRGILASMQSGTTDKGVEDRIADLERAAATPKPFPLVRLSGFFQLDTGLFSQDAASHATLGDIQNGTGFRRARLQALGKLTEHTNFSIEMDFAFAGRPSFFDVWGEQTNLPIGNVRVGNFRQPITMDSWTSVRHLEFLERSAPFTALDPFRRVGVMDWWNSEDGNTLIAGSFYAPNWTFWNGTATQYSSLGLDDRFGTSIGDNGGVGVALRGSHLLYYDEPANGRYLLHVGGGYNFSQIGGNGVNAPGTVGGQTYRATTIPEFFVGDQAGSFSTFAGTPNVLDTGRFLASNFSLYHVELAGNAGQFHWQTEVMGEAVAQYNGPLVFYGGAYAQCGYFLTGESAGYNKLMGVLDYNCSPYRQFLGTGAGRGMCGWGAWEVAARWSYLDLQSDRINPANYQGAGAINPVTGVPIGLTTGNGGAGPSATNPNPGVLNESTVALNWYWNQYTKVQFNWIHNMLSSQYHGYSVMDAFTARYQIEF